MKRWKRDLGLVRELGPDRPEFDSAVARVWVRLDEYEEALKRAQAYLSLSSYLVGAEGVLEDVNAALRDHDA